MKIYNVYYMMNTFKLYSIYHIKNQKLNQTITLYPDQLQLFNNNMLIDITIDDLIKSNINVKYEYLININAKIISNNCYSDLNIIMNVKPQQIITITKIYPGINNININTNLGIYDNLIDIDIIEDPICNNHIESITSMYIRINVINNYYSNKCINKNSISNNEIINYSNDDLIKNIFTYSSNTLDERESSIPMITSPNITISNNEFFQSINNSNPFKNTISATITIIIIVIIIIVIFKLIEYYKHK